MGIFHLLNIKHITTFASIANLTWKRSCKGSRLSLQKLLVAAVVLAIPLLNLHTLNPEMKQTRKKLPATTTWVLSRGVLLVLIGWVSSIWRVMALPETSTKLNLCSKRQPRWVMVNRTFSFSNFTLKLKKRKTLKRHTCSWWKLWLVVWPFSINYMLSLRITLQCLDPSSAGFGSPLHRLIAMTKFSLQTCMRPWSMI